MAASKPNTLCYEGYNFFRERLILATLSGKSVKLKIKLNAEDIGANGSEKVFIQMLGKISNGMSYFVNHAGTEITYRPGILVGGAFELDCGTERAIGYYLQAIMYLVPFTKNATRVVFRGITSDNKDPSVDLIKFSSLPVLKRFLGYDEGLELKIPKRGAAPDGGGEVIFSCPCRAKLRPINFTDCGKVKRIRGLAWATRVSPAICNRMVVAARGVLNKCLPDIFITTDHKKGGTSGKSPGFGLTLVAETSEGSFLCAEASSNPRGEGEPTVAEDLGENVATKLLQEIYKGGCVDSYNQGLSASLMVLGDKHVSKLKVGNLSQHTIQTMQLIRDFFNVKFKLDSIAEDEQSGASKVLLTCVGSGYRNIAKATQ